AQASWPIATWRKPGSSPARKRSSTFSSKRRMRSISRSTSWRSLLARLALCSTLATARVYGSAVPLAERWNAVERGLDPRWTEVTLSLRINDDSARSRAAALLGPAGPGIGTQEIRFDVSTQGAGIGPEAARRLLRRLDAEGLVGRLELVEILGVRPEPEPPARSLEAEWREALEVLPSDWSDVVAELELHSSADIERAAVLCAPINPMQSPGGKPGFRFRS